ncbi:TetR/AcrR family transcriptional regulator [Streptomyces sp. Ru87]|uniref:TetR/AcrR family transcriptional regulator n=1 Tax=Streptomyces sp. Ru87 TaxID=2044307 RepID=UPI000BF6E347|nr:TetR/AcrR family transcriptional regulator [Streptomyces sp. Ru87]PGH47498.1 TetR family transcriptional regulator [Streptomyces sp. Ru87]
MAESTPGTAPGRAGATPGRAGVTPDRADAAPGRAGVTPDRAGAAPEPRRRADAVRNREAVLDAAEALFTRSGPAGVSMSSVAAAAGVGKGTVFRAFTDRTGLLQALAERRSAPLRRAVAEGPAPLGPGTPPRERVPALLDAAVRHKVDNGALHLALEEAGAASPYQSPSYTWWHATLRESLARVVDPDGAGFTAHALLAAVRADLITHLTGVERMPVDELRARLAAYVATFLPGTGPGAEAETGPGAEAETGPGRDAGTEVQA